ncbi:MAG: hypothetical protein H7840_06735 [Alphaproteobacteria bacterium]
MTLPVSEILHLVRLYALPFLAPLANADGGRSPWPGRQDLVRIWLDEGAENYGLDSLRSQFDLVWGVGRDVDPFRLYRDLASAFLESRGDRLRLRLPRGLPVVAWEENDALLFWHFLGVSIGTDFLPAAFAETLPEAVRNRLITPGLRVDPVTSRVLDGILEQGLVDCHLHYGSAFHFDDQWSGWLGDVEAAFLGMRQLPWVDNRVSVDERFSFRILSALLIRRTMIWWMSRDQGDDTLARTVRRLTDDRQVITEDARQAEVRDLLYLLQRLLVGRQGTEPSEAALMVALLDRQSQSWQGLGTSGRNDFAILRWRYLWFKARFARDVIQTQARPGLGFFRENYYSRNSVLREHVRPATILDDLTRQLSPHGRVAGLELRLAPQHERLIIDLLNECRRAAGLTGIRLGVIVHFIKPNRLDDVSLADRLVDLRLVSRQLQDLLETCRYDDVLSHFIGIDVASSEAHAPNWLYLPLFREFRPWWSRLFTERQPGYTFHAGEDFMTFPQGLRHVGEIVGFFPWQEGDRIGHGLALGLDAGRWLRESRTASAPVATLLFDRIWEWGMHTRHGVSLSLPGLALLEAEIERLGRLFLPGARMSLRSEQWWWFYRGLFCPPLITDIVGPSAAFGGVDPGDADVRRQVMADESIVGALRYYLNDRRAARDAANQHEPYKPVLPLEDEARRLHDLQEWLIDDIGRRVFVVEACPISNLAIRRLYSFSDHPLLRLRDRIPLVIATDNPSLFSTSLCGEFEHVDRLLANEGIPALARTEVLERLVANGRRYSFLSFGNSGRRQEAPR